MAKKIIKEDEIVKLVREVSLEVSQWPQWLQQNAEALLASKKKKKSENSSNK